MDKQNISYHCKNCGHDALKRTGFIYPAKVRIDLLTNKIKFNISPFYIFTFTVLLSVSIIKLAGYILDLGEPKTLIYGAIFIFAIIILALLIYMRIKNTVTAYVYRCSNCGIVWLLKKNDSPSAAIRADSKFQKIFDIEKYPLRKDLNEKTWKCRNCGEAVPEDIDVCWNCQAEREEKIL